VNTAVTQLDQMTQQNAALVEESAAAAASLKEQANKLTSVVSTFRIAATQEAPALAVVAAHGEAHPVAKQAIQRAQKAAAPVVAAPKKAAPPTLTQAAPVTATPAPAAPKPVAPSDDDWETF